ncbi:DNA repair protein RecN [Sedimenticola thiotaurini]|uniref:DNA repair protein RecN n=1 Tax=Sedimenticola thiotaurini TaxID=1543721 RepID=A0A0F7JYY1_9GAMM|nr:DNA repair protein RecN [Sedimenticola thiotaurini]AKH19883.1 recombination and repair protein [Sedimenticola thiotaurini]
MLQQINIKDLAIVSSLEVELFPGMTVLTGETGAGKSILVDALGLVLGDRADTGMIRNDCDRAEITAIFDIRELPAVNQWLEENTLDDDGQCIIRRVLLRNGSSRAYINGSPAPLKSLQAIGEQLVDIHGQHAHQSLLRRQHQRALLDEYAGHGKLCQETARCYLTWREAEQELATLRSNEAERSARIDLLRYQINELNSLELGENELAELLQEHGLLSNAGNIIEHCNSALNLLDDEDAALSRINRAYNELQELSGMDSGLKSACDLLDSAAIQVSEALSSLRHYADNLELDPARLDHLDQRLQEIHDLARKYRCKPEEIPALLQQLQEELGQLEQSDTHLTALATQVDTLWNDYLGNARKLSQSRQEAAERLAQQVSDCMRTLDMPNGQFVAQVTPVAQDKATTNGLDQIDFLVSANPGQPPKPLAKVASGGELSRISLAIQVATASCTQVPTLIFDEVDVGIGGGTAEIVGRLLRQIGDSRQVLCVTHLPQVASQGHQHLRIEKASNGQETRTQVGRLDGDSRIDEIARMLGGVEITAQTLSHAREMVERTNS